jgi:putative spermidine/putrescine transport system permease protein
MAQPFASPLERAGRIAFRALCALILAFLVLPILAIVPLSLNGGSFLSYPLDGLSLRWYRELFTSPLWLPAIRNSVLVALATTALATPLGALAAIGMMRLSPKVRPVFMGLVLSPMITPVIVTAIGAYFLYARLGLTNSFAGLVLAHTTLAVPFVVMAVQASLQGFDTALLRAGASLGAPPATVFVRILAPLIAPGIFAGGLFAFMTSFDEIVMAIFLAGRDQRTLPLQMFDGVRDQVSPTITAAATLLILTSIVLLTTAELLRRRRAGAARP